MKKEEDKSVPRLYRTQANKETISLVQVLRKNCRPVLDWFSARFAEKRWRADLIKEIHTKAWKKRNECSSLIDKALSRSELESAYLCILPNI